MTLPEFLAELARAPFTWSLTEVGLRTGEHSHCPLTAVCEVVTGEVFDPCCAVDAGDRLDLPEEATLEVMLASDSPWSGTLRDQLLVATRLRVA